MSLDIKPVPWSNIGCAPAQAPLAHVPLPQPSTRSAEAREAWKKAAEAEADAKDWSKAAQAFDQELRRVQAELDREKANHANTRQAMQADIDKMRREPAMPSSMALALGLRTGSLEVEADAWFALAQQYGEEKATLDTEVKTLRQVVHEANEEMNLVRDQMLLAEGMAALHAARVKALDAHLRVIALLRDRADSIPTTSNLDEMRTQIIALSNDFHDVLDGVKAWP